jgi:hypothetical protein
MGLGCGEDFLGRSLWTWLTLPASGTSEIIAQDVVVVNPFRNFFFERKFP